MSPEENGSLKCHFLQLTRILFWISSEAPQGPSHRLVPSSSDILEDVKPTVHGKLIVAQWSRHYFQSSLARSQTFSRLNIAPMIPIQGAIAVLNELLLKSAQNRAEIWGSCLRRTELTVPPACGTRLNKWELKAGGWICFCSELWTQMFRSGSSL